VSVGGIILAAGHGARMGRPKQLLTLDGRPLLQHVIDTAAAAPLDGVVVVLGHAFEEVAAALSLPPGVTIAVNPLHAQGQSTSLRAGLAGMPDRVAAAVVLLGDQPELRADAVRAVVEAQARSAAPILRAAYGGRAAHPVVLARAVWDEAAAQRGDSGARALISAHSGEVELVEVGGDPPQDIDTPADLERLRARWTSPSAG
jgi:nicotine blue oxidoreductase